MMFVLILRLVFLNGQQDDWVFETPNSYTSLQECQHEARILLGVFKQDQVRPYAKCVKKYTT